MAAARCRPVGDVQRQIVILLIARPDRETQVVADLGQDAPAAPFENFTPVAGLVVQMFAGHAEQVAFVIGMHLAARLDQQEAVDRTLVSFQRHAAAD